MCYLGVVDLKKLNPFFSNRIFFLKQFIIIFVLVSLVLGVIFYLYNRSESAITITKIKSNQKALVLAQKKYIESAIFAISRDILFLADFIENHRVYEHRNSVLFKIAELNTLALSFRKGKYDQIRFLDLDGMEVLRINYNKGEPDVVDLADLQPKGNRYYFKDSIGLEKDQIYVSVLDLNVENGKVEIPYKPIIRFAAPVFDNAGKKRGIAILNYLAQELIEGLDFFRLNDEYHHMLVNQEGFFLHYDEKPNSEFAFMFPNSEEKRVSTIFPLFDEYIAPHDEGQIHNSEGIFTYTSVYPLQSNWKSSTGSTRADDDSEYMIDAHDYRWQIITYVSNSTLKNSRKGSKNVLMLLFSFLVLAILAAYVIARLQLQKKLSAMEIEKLAHHDGLTGLVNRRFYIELLKHYLALAHRRKNKLALLFVDLDRFKPINDQYGHGMGDYVLKIVSDRMNLSVRDSDIVARIGGDEFVIILNDLTNKEQVIPVVERLLKSLKESISFGSHECSIGASIGISIYPGDGDDVDTLTRKADMAMYEIKKSGRNSYSFSK